MTSGIDEVFSVWIIPGNVSVRASHMVHYLHSGIYENDRKFVKDCERLQNR